MSKIKDVGKSIQKKLSLADYNSKPEHQHDSKDANSEAHSTQRPSKKKVTFYFDTDTDKKFNDVFLKKLINGKKIDKSALIKRAVNLLWEDEKNYGK